jgi:hypothetical protein
VGQAATANAAANIFIHGIDAILKQLLELQGGAGFNLA